MKNQPLRNLIVRMMRYVIVDEDGRRPYYPTEKEFEFIEKVMDIESETGCKGIPTAAELCLRLPTWPKEEVVKARHKMFKIHVVRESAENFLGGWIK